MNYRYRRRGVAPHWNTAWTAGDVALGLGALLATGAAVWIALGG